MTLWSQKSLFPPHSSYSTLILLESVKKKASCAKHIILPIPNLIISTAFA